MLTSELDKELYQYLKNENYYSERTLGEIKKLNSFINQTWSRKLWEALDLDLKVILNDPNIQTRQIASVFEIENDRSQGATTFLSQIELIDRDQKMDIVVNLIVSHNAFIYLGKSHAHLSEYPGSSKALQKLFWALKQNERIGHFFQTKFYQLDLNKPLIHESHGSLREFVIEMKKRFAQLISS